MNDLRGKNQETVSGQNLSPALQSVLQPRLNSFWCHYVQDASHVQIQFLLVS